MIVTKVEILGIILDRCKTEEIGTVYTQLSKELGLDSLIVARVFIQHKLRTLKILYPDWDLWEML